MPQPVAICLIINFVSVNALRNSHADGGCRINQFPSRGLSDNTFTELVHSALGEMGEWKRRERYRLSAGVPLISDQGQTKRG